MKLVVVDIDDTKGDEPRHHSGDDECPLVQIESIIKDGDQRAHRELRSEVHDGFSLAPARLQAACEPSQVARKAPGKPRQRLGRSPGCEP